MNFTKSCLFGVSLGRNFLGWADDFIHYKVDSLLFKYLLRFSMGVNSNKFGTWDPLI